MSEPIVKLSDVCVRYGEGARTVEALRGVTLNAAPGEFVSIMGPSGSGKTTLLNVLSGLETPSSGQVVVAGKDLAALSEADLARMRRTTVAHVFQFFGLLPMLDASENVAVPLRAERMAGSEIRARVAQALAAVGMMERAHHYPDELSGGEMQRVAIARALATDAAVLLADEPTGNLDRVRAEELLELLRSACEAQARTVILVTHDLIAAAYADRMVTLRDGRIVDEVEQDSERRVVQLGSERRRGGGDET